MTEDRESNGRLAKGHRYLGGGRKKGQQNAVKKELRDLLREFSIENYNKFIYAMSNCEPKDFCRYYIEVLKFNVPALQSIDLTAQESLQRTIEDRLLALSERRIDIKKEVSNDTPSGLCD